jgi:hypothetical protein
MGASLALAGILTLMVRTREQRGFAVMVGSAPEPAQRA